MWFENKKLIISSLVYVFEYVAAQDYFELKHHTQHLRSHNNEDFKHIPNKFEIKGDNPLETLQKNFKDIQKLADKENMRVIYKIKVETVKQEVEQEISKNKFMKKLRLKKYNVPLKKKSMKLSHFERVLRKLADQNIAQMVVIHPVLTTEDTFQIPLTSTTKIPVMKYKPIISKTKTHYRKIIRPVKRNLISLK